MTRVQVGSVSRRRSARPGAKPHMHNLYIHADKVDVRTVRGGCSATSTNGGRCVQSIATATRLRQRHAVALLTSRRHSGLHNGFGWPRMLRQGSREAKLSPRRCTSSLAILQTSNFMHAFYWLGGTDPVGRVSAICPTTLPRNVTQLFEQQVPGPSCNTKDNDDLIMTLSDRSIRCDHILINGSRA